MNLGLEGKSVVVSGSSRGIGCGIARGFLAEGANVTLAARGEDQLEATRAELSSEFPSAGLVAVRGDMSTVKGVNAAIDATLGAFGRVDCAIANVGSGRSQSGWDVEIEEWDRMLDLNLRSAVLLCGGAARRMVEGGAITIIGSIAGLEDLGAPMPYNAAKAALTRYAKDLARRLATQGIRVNMVAPGNILFPGGRWDELLADRREEIEQYISEQVPMARFGTADEIADAALFLSSERASFITGACLVVDGGETRA